MPKALHKKEWRNIKDIEKCDDGFKYQLEGVDGKVYHRDIDDFDLSKEDTHEIVNPDGSITRGPGKEPLRKPLKKSLAERWQLLKAAISHEKAFMDMVDHDEADKEPGGSNEADRGNQPQQDAQSSDNDEAPQGDEAVKTQIPDPDEEDDSDAIGDINPGVMGKDTSPDTDAEKNGADEEGGEPDSSYDEAKLIEMLRSEGYSDPEIAHIVHGHVPGDQSSEVKAATLEQQRDQEKHDHHMDRLKGQTDIQTDHARRMADLEYEHAKREKELRIKHLEEELKTKLEHLKNKGRTDGKAD